MYICLGLLVLTLAASPLRAEPNRPEPQAAAQKVVRKKSIVRADPRTGKLVTQVIAVTPRLRKPPAEVARIVEETSRANDVDPLLVQSVIEVESAYNANAVSPKGAQGLMQLMPATARDLGVENSFDPRQNIEAGVRYLKQLQDLYQDDRLALAAYNAGPKAVSRYGNVPPYRETQDYVRRVGEKYSEAKAAGTNQTVAMDRSDEPAATDSPAEVAAAVLSAGGANPAGPAKKEDTHPKLEQYVDEYGRLHLKTVEASAPR